ncbi:hypothetical protein HI914_00623 [Erysiphe necator]|nr:hypothetical protein HI914_00623 [Erysiphe necator]
MSSKRKKNKKIEFCFINWVLGGSLFSYSSNKKNHLSVPSKAIAAEIELPTNVNEVNNQEAFHENENRLEDVVALKKSKELNVMDVFKESIHKEINGDKISIGDCNHDEGYNRDTITLEEMDEGSAIEHDEGNKINYQVKNETVKSDGSFGEMEEDRFSYRESYDQNCSLNILTQEKMLNEQLIQQGNKYDYYENSQEEEDEVDYCENMKDDKDKTSHTSSQNVDYHQKIFAKTVVSEECTKKENNIQCEGDSASYKGSNTESEKDISSERGFHPDTNTNKKIKNEIPSTVKTAIDKEGIVLRKEGFSDNLGCTSNYSTVGDNNNNNNNNNRDYRQWGGDIHITVYGVLNFNANDIYSEKQVEEEQRKDETFPPPVTNSNNNNNNINDDYNEDSMEVKNPVPDDIKHDDTEGIENLLKKNEYLSSLSSKQPYEGETALSQSTLRPDDNWSAKDCELLESLMDALNSNKWSTLQKEFTSKTNRSINPELIAKKFHDDYCLTSSTCNSRASHFNLKSTSLEPQNHRELHKNSNQKAGSKNKSKKKK